jgi:hypothetical protein
VIVDFSVGQVSLLFSLCNQGFKSGLLMHSVGHAGPSWVWQKIAGDYNGLGSSAPMRRTGKCRAPPSGYGDGFSLKNGRLDAGCFALR